MNFLIGAFPIAFLIIFIISFGGIHKIEEGYVGIYYRFGVLQNELSEPGYHVLLPMVTRFESVQVSVQTDAVVDIPCGTSGGVMIYFDKIEVVNRLRKDSVFQTIKNYTSDYDRIWIYDKIHHEINQFCSIHSLQEVFITKFDILDESLMHALQEDFKVWAPGLEIISIRVTKPRIPTALKSKFEEIESEKTNLMITSGKQNVLIQELNTKKREKLIKAQSELEVTRINLEKKIQERQNQMNMSRIDNEMRTQSSKMQSDSLFEKNKKEVETMQDKFTPEYLEFIMKSNLLRNTNFVLGKSIPTYMPTAHSANFQQKSTTQSIQSSENQQQQM